MYTYFTETDRANVEALKQAFRRLAIKFHPDRNRDKDTTQEMKDINNEYQKILESIQNNNHYSDKERYKAGKERDSQYAEIISNLMKYESISVELCGLWLWIGGETKAIKEDLKKMGCKWARKKKMWYWRPAGLKSFKRTGKEYSMDEIRKSYGSEIKKEKDQKGGDLFRQAQ